MADRRSPSPYLRRVWVDAAWQRLWAAFDAGLGGVPADVTVEPQVVRGQPGPVLVDVASSLEDLLILGTGRRSTIGRLLRHSAGRYCLAHARCPVLAVPPPPLVAEMSHGLRSWQLRRHAAHGFR
jgi:nucleotide-binding universal stress UspA family protein